ncbi:uncharacterized protein LOC115714653 [Cannabis sativa]|uniref:uncharacterized protein LOC115714653 n=1 Tax=Cannabis sativa TaxID=3483 RepID=UPI0029C9BB9D|nr:uncharacterized protein LOC115714653 [Cannabis sativa]
MGQGQEVKIRPESQVQIQERGEIFFFYRPKVNKEEVHSADEVQRLYIVLRPESGERSVEEKQDQLSGKEGFMHKSSQTETTVTSGSYQGGHGTEEVNIEKQPLLRLILMGKKSLPDPAKKKGVPYWGFVELVTTQIEDIKTALKGEEYETSTRGHRHQPGGRALGEGIYRILRHYPNKKMHTHLIYKLEFPAENAKNEPQESLNIERQGSFLIQIKNPDDHGQQHGGGSTSTSSSGGASGFRGLPKKRKAMFPAHLQGQFGHNRYSPADPPDFLNYEGCEFLLIAASDDIGEELGLDLKPEGCDSSDKSCSDLVNTFGENAAYSTKPLFEGTWD